GGALRRPLPHPRVGDGRGGEGGAPVVTAPLTPSGRTPREQVAFWRAAAAKTADKQAEAERRCNELEAARLAEVHATCVRAAEAWELAAERAEAAAERVRAAR